MNFFSSSFAFSPFCFSLFFLKGLMERAPDSHPFEDPERQVGALMGTPSVGHEKLKPCGMRFPASVSFSENICYLMGQDNK
jgi:hypothetical protein